MMRIVVRVELTTDRGQTTQLEIENIERRGSPHEATRDRFERKQHAFNEQGAEHEEQCCVVEQGEREVHDEVL